MNNLLKQILKYFVSIMSVLLLMFFLINIMNKTNSLDNNQSITNNTIETENTFDTDYSTRTDEDAVKTIEAGPESIYMVLEWKTGVGVDGLQSDFMFLKTGTGAENEEHIFKYGGAGSSGTFGRPFHLNELNEFKAFSLSVTSNVAHFEMLLNEETINELYADGESRTDENARVTPSTKFTFHMELTQGSWAQNVGFDGDIDLDFNTAETIITGRQTLQTTEGSFRNFTQLEVENSTRDYDLYEVNFTMDPYFYDYSLNDFNIAKLYLDDTEGQSHDIEQVNLLNDYIDPDKVYDQFNLETIEFNIQNLEPSTTYQFSVFYEFDDAQTTGTYPNGTSWTQDYEATQGAVKLPKLTTGEGPAQYYDDSFEIRDMSLSDPSFSGKATMNFYIGLDTSFGLPIDDTKIEVYYENTQTNDFNELPILDYHRIEDEAEYVEYEMTVDLTGLPDNTEMDLYFYLEGKDYYDDLIDSGSSLADLYQISDPADLNFTTFKYPEAHDFYYDVNSLLDTDTTSSATLFYEIYQQDNDYNYLTYEPDETEFRYNSAESEEYVMVDTSTYNYNEEVYSWEIDQLPINEELNFEIKTDNDSEWTTLGTLSTAAKENIYVEGSFVVDDVQQKSVEFSFDYKAYNEYLDLTHDDIEIRISEEGTTWSEGNVVSDNLIDIKDNDREDSIAHIGVNIQEEDNNYLERGTNYLVYVKNRDFEPVQIGEFTTTNEYPTLIDTTPVFEQNAADPTTEYMTVEIISGNYEDDFYEEFSPSDLVMTDSQGNNYELEYQTQVNEHEYKYKISNLIGGTSYNNLSLMIKDNENTKVNLDLGFTTADLLPIEYIVGEDIVFGETTQTTAQLTLPITVGTIYEDKYDNSSAAISKVEMRYNQENGEVISSKYFDLEYIEGSENAEFEITNLEYETTYSDFEMSVDSGSTWQTFEGSFTTQDSLATEIVSPPEVIDSSITSHEFQFEVTFKSGGEYRVFNPETDFVIYDEYNNKIPLTIYKQEQISPNELKITYQINDLIPETTYDGYKYKYLIKNTEESEIMELDWSVETGETIATSAKFVENSQTAKSVEVEIKTDKEDFNHENVAFKINGNRYDFGTEVEFVTTSGGSGVDTAYVYVIKDLTESTTYTSIEVAVDKDLNNFTEFDTEITTNDLKPPEIGTNSIEIIDNSITSTTIDIKIDITDGGDYQTWIKPNVGEVTDNLKITLTNEETKETDYYDLVYLGSNYEGNIEYDSFRVTNLVCSTEYSWNQIEVQGDQGDDDDWTTSNVMLSEFETAEGEIPIDYDNVEILNIKKTSVDIRLNLFNGNEYEKFISDDIKFYLADENSTSTTLFDSELTSDGFTIGDSFVTYTISGLIDGIVYNQLEIAYNGNKKVPISIGDGFQTEQLDSPIDGDSFKMIYNDKTSATFEFSLVDEYEYDINLEKMYVVGYEYIDVNINEVYDEGTDEVVGKIDRFDTDITAPTTDNPNYVIKFNNLTAGRVYSKIKISADGEERHEKSFDGYISTKPYDSAFVNDSFEMVDITKNSIKFDISIDDDGVGNDIEDIFINGAKNDGVIEKDELNYDVILIASGDGEIDKEFTTFDISTSERTYDSSNLETWKLTVVISGFTPNTEYNNISIKFGYSSIINLDDFTFSTLINIQFITLCVVVALVALVILGLILYFIFSKIIFNKREIKTRKINRKNISRW